ncbi:MAG: putative toxin-antitoxin system toxin component, PIN family [Gemmatimonadetes bacterium]|nr:putative toxin-antitoxin system toxin component, PIN family [Gemmatimonadota bacterium]
MRVFLDTNVLVSAYAARGICADLVRFILAEHQLLTGEVNLEELRRVLRVRFRAPAERLYAIEAELRAETVVPRPADPSPVRVRDADDRWVLASAIDGGADLLVTGDGDLLAVASQVPIPILDPRGCWNRLRGAG